MAGHHEHVPRPVAPREAPSPNAGVVASRSSYIDDQQFVRADLAPDRVHGDRWRPDGADDDVRRGGGGDGHRWAAATLLARALSTTR